MTVEMDFNPTFSGSFHEHEWIMESMGGFHRDHLITDVLYRVKGGKEATVYCCKAHPSTGRGLIAAKVYRPRMFRAMRNDAIYREGRETLGADGKAILDRRSLLAIRKKTRYGRRLTAASWLQHEYDTMSAFHAAGADVVEPIAIGNNAVLMEYVGDEGFGAPVLHSVRLAPDESQGLFDRLMKNVELFLSCELIHADLSAHNVLYWRGDFRIIDFPQAVDAFNNPNAFMLLSRDIERLCQYFERYGIRANAAEIAAGLWTRFLHREL